MMQSAKQGSVYRKYLSIKSLEFRGPGLNPGPPAHGANAQLLDHRCGQQGNVSASMLLILSTKRKLAEPFSAGACLLILLLLLLLLSMSLFAARVACCMFYYVYLKPFLTFSSPFRLI